MNDETPPPFDTVGDAPVEARIVAWVLGETSAFEAAELERLCEERPELLVFRRRMAALHGLLADVEAAEKDRSWKLPSDKRRVLDEIMGEEHVTRLEPDLIRPEAHPERRIRRSGRRAIWAIAACVALTLFIVRLTPRKHEAEAIIEVKSRASGTSPLGQDRGNTSSLSPQFFGTEFEKIKSRSALEKVVDNLELAQRWGVDKESAVQRVKDSIVTSKVSGTDLISIRAREASERDAQEITQEVVRAYQNYRRSLESQQADKELAELNKAVRDQEDKVEERRKVLSTLVRTKGVIYKGQDSFYGQSGVDEEERLKNVDVMKNDSREDAIKRGLDAQDYADAKRDFETDQQLLQAMRLKQIGENIANKMTEESVVVHSMPQKLEPEKPKSSPSQPAVPAKGNYRVESKQSQPSGELGMKQAKEQSMLAKRPAMAATPAAPGQSQLPAAADFSVIDPLPALAASELGEGRGMGAGAQWAGKDSAAAAPESALAVNGFGLHASPRSRSAGERESRLADGRKNVPPVLADRVDAGAKLDLDSKSLSESKPVDAIKSERAESKVMNESLSQLDIAGGAWAEMQGAPSSSSQFEIAKEFQDTTEFEPPAEDVKLLADLATEIPASESPYSTLSLNISDASFQLVKAALARGERPDPAAIKPEQFYNAVDYGDPAPTSNEPVAATIEQTAHPVIPGRNLVRVALRTGSVGRSAVQPLRLTLLVDQSGSMVREDRRASMEHALAQLGVLLTPNDRVTVIGFSRTPHILAEAKAGDPALKLGELVNQAASEGGTNLEEAMKLGGQLATRHQLAGAQNRIVLFTDGAANLGDANPARLAELVKSFRQQGLAFDIAGIGADGLNDRLLSELARNGNGRYYVVGSENNDSFARQLAGAFRPAAENVKVQVNFNPQRVGKYRLIGFEKDRLKTEDFRHDAVDAAELAAEEAGVAIYQIEPLAEGTGEIGEVSVRFRDAASKEMVERSWTIPYDAQATAFDRATPSMQLAGLALLAAEKLQGGPLADAIDFKQLTGPSSLVKQFYASSSRVAEMLQVIEKLK